MTHLEIVTVDQDNPVLRQEARPVRAVSRRVRRLMDDMVETMREAPGVGLAAPQVGRALRVIVIETPIDGDDARDDEEAPAMRLLQLADPEITWRSEAVEEDQEACLSIPRLYGDVPRHLAIRVSALDRSGRRVEIEAEGFEARVLQHEVDHLDGILFTDRVTGIDKLYTLRREDDGTYTRVPFALPGPAA